MSCRIPRPAGSPPRRLALGVAPLEDFGQQREQPPPKPKLDGMQEAAVEAAFAYHHLGHVAVLVEERAGFVEVAAEEGCGATKGTVITSAVDILA